MHGHHMLLGHTCSSICSLPADVVQWLKGLTSSMALEKDP